MACTLQSCASKPKSPPQIDSIIAYAKKLIGTPYKYSSINQQEGFDCSGFIYHVFKKFDVTLSRSSYTMVEEGTEVDFSKARKGDLIFFRGTNVNDPKIGHVGMIISEKGESIQFIHSSSGKKHNGVVISALSDGNYKQRFVTIRRIVK